jgi:hypothetical protein
MAFNFNNAQSSEMSQSTKLFKDGVNYSYLKADERRPLSFRILPAFEEHTELINCTENAQNYVPAVSLINGTPTVSDWIFAIKVSRAFIKGSSPIVSRKTLVEFDQDGRLIDQEDPLTKVQNYCKQYSKSWGYLIQNVGEWGSKDRQLARLPLIKQEYLMNILTLDDEKPGVKIGVIASAMAIANLVSNRAGFEGIAVRQTTREISQAEFESNPACVFLYGDITDPNNAPIFKYSKGLSEDGGKKVYKITVSTRIDTNTGRQKVERIPLTLDQMAQRVDLAHPETYINIPTCEEQVRQIVERCNQFNAEGVHEYDMLRAALPEYASLIPDTPSNATGTTGATNVVMTTAQDFLAEEPTQATQTIQPTQTKVAQATQTVQQVQPAQTKVVKATPKFVPKAVSSQPTAQANPEGAGIPGEVNFSEDDWMNQYMDGGK